MLDHPGLAEIEVERAALFAVIETAQGEYRQLSGRFLQLPRSPVTDQAGDRLVDFDRSLKVSDESLSWADLVSADDVAGGVAGQYYVHRYDGPRGRGFVLGCRLVWNRAEWRYEEHYGPEDRDGPFGVWVEIVEPVLESLDGE